MVSPDVAVGEAVSLLGPFVDFGVKSGCFGVISHVTRLFILPRGEADSEKSSENETSFGVRHSGRFRNAPQTCHSVPRMRKLETHL